MIEKVQDLGSGDQRPPLCCRYLVICFKSLPRLPVACESSDGVPILWAMGALADASAEVIGAWLPVSADQPAWDEAANEIRHRGVEQVRVVVAEDLGAEGAAFPGDPIVVLEAACTSEWSSSSGPSRRQRRIVERTSLLADSMHVEIVRRLRRRGPFCSAADALEFVEKSLMRAERRVGASVDALNGALPRP